MTLRVGFHITLCAALTLTGCAAREGEVARDAEAGTPWTIESGNVLFTARRAGNSDLYVLHPPDTVPIRLTTDAAPDNFGRYAPDGRHIAFQSRPGSATDIFVMTADGDAVRNLTDDPAYEVLPTWSPDGARIAFMSTRGYELGSIGPFPGHLYAIDADGANLRQLTKEPLTSSLGPQDWSPDGRTILLSRDVDGSLDLFLLDVATGEETRITSDPTREYGAAFSHDGARIAFHAETDDASQIVVMDRDGGNRRAVTAGPGFRYGPRWSPDDAWLLFTALGASENDYDLRAVRLADGEERAIVVTPEDEREGEWVPHRAMR